MKIAHGCLTWQDGRVLLERCLRSTAPYVDHILISEGLIDGVPDLGLSPHSDLAWMAEPSDFLPDELPISSHAAWPGIAPWPTLSSKCNWLLGEARRRDCEWLLILDADEELHNGDRLRTWLEGWPPELAAFPIPRRDGRLFKRAPWHLLRVPLIRRYVHGVGYVQLADGRTVWLVDEDGHEAPEVLTRAPWISHHPELRPPWRRTLRLGEWETKLEPQPTAPTLRLPSLLSYSRTVNTAAETPDWFCPACGRRYFGPGVCSNNHPPTELLLAGEPPAVDTPQEGGEAQTAPEAADGLGVAEIPADSSVQATTADEVVPPAEPASQAPATDAPPSADAGSGAASPSTDAPASATAAAGDGVEQQAAADVSLGVDTAAVAPSDPKAEATGFLSQAADLLHKAAALLAGL